MTVTDLSRVREELEAELSDLARRIDEAVGASMAAVTLDAARAAVKEAGLRRFEDMFLGALEAADEARRRKRTAVAERAEAKDQHDGAVSEAEWGLGDHFETRSNKQWLARNLDGTAIVEDEQRSMTADEKRDWIARAAARTPAVAKAKHDLDVADEAVAQANDDIAKWERDAKAAEHLLDAAREHLVVLATALRAPARANTSTNGAAAR